VIESSFPVFGGCCALDGWAVPPFEADPRRSGAGAM
jgi:hypothetical protein